MPPGGSVAFPVTLSDPAPAGGLVVNLETVNGAIGTVDAMVTIPTGATSADATARGVADGTTTIEASAANYASDTTVLVVKTVTMRFDPSGTIAVASGMPTTRRVLLSDAAPPGGIRVTLDVDDDALTFVSPTSVVVPEGQLDSPSFQITGTTQGSTTLRASETVVTPTSARLNVGPPPDLTVNGNGATVGAGLHRDFSISLNTPAPAGGLAVSLASSNPDAATVPASVNVPAGQSSRSFRVTGVDVGTVQITASAENWKGSTATVNVATATLVLNGIQTARTTSSAAHGIYVYPHTPSCGACDYFNADTPVTYTVNSATPEIVTVSPSPATAQRDAWSTANASVSTPTTTGTYTITASAPGFTTATSQTVTVTSP